VVWPLVGRDEECAFVGGVLSEGSAGGVVLSGGAGVGKSRLAHAAAEAAAAAGCAVRWVRATRSAASLPLGAFAALFPPEAPVGSVSVLAGVRRALAALAGGRRLALCVDDAHLLDEGSAALVHQLVAAGEAFAVVTVRSGEPVPDAVRALWKDDLCAFLQVSELSRVEVERLLRAVLAGPVDGRSANRLWELTRGNVLFLRELVLHGFEHDALAAEGGIWRWRGEIGPGVRLADLVGARVGELDPDAREVLELVAVGAPHELGLFDASDARIEVLEARGIVAARVDGRRRFVDLVHPLHGEVVRGRLARTRLAMIQGRLAHAVEECGARRREDVLRVAAWRLESGTVGAPELFVRAAQQALAALDWPLASRFARAAVQAGGGFGARLALGQALAGAGDAAEADELLAALEPQASDDAGRARVAVARARNLFWGLDRASDADGALLAAEQAIADPALRDELVALRARLTSAQGRPLAALAAAGPLVESLHAAEQARLRAAIAVSEALWLRGRTGDAVAVAERWEPVARRAELPLIEGQLASERVFALWLAGRLSEASEAAERLYELDLARRSAQNTAVASLTLGLVWLARGRVRTALRWFRESAVLLRGADTIGMRPWAVAGITQAAAQAGDRAAARVAARELEGVPRRGTGLFEAELQLARAWSAALAGEHSRARELALAAADHAQARGQDGLAMRALHELTRLGEPTVTASRLAAVAHRVDGPFAGIAAAHAAALLERDGGALIDVAERFVAQGAVLAAAEAAGAAAAAHREAGREASARAAAARTAVLLEDCEGARPPTLPGPGLADELTRREREIAVLAASGLSSRQIADRLVVSVRTVDNHLQRAYRKLGISSRDELAGLVTAPE
jgi:DNA-binding CsgD family transcriptional regulator